MSTNQRSTKYTWEIERYYRDNILIPQSYLIVNAKSLIIFLI